MAQQQISFTIPSGLVQVEPEINWWRFVPATLGFAVVSALVPTLVKNEKAHLSLMALTGAAAYAVGVYAAKNKYV